MVKKRGQVTIFIILAIIIIAIIVLFFLVREKVIPEIGRIKETGPVPFLESCIEDKVREGVEIISLQGGSINNPLHRRFKFEGEEEFRDISYLCYNQNDYLPCINQEPMLIQHLEDEMHDYISEDVDDCFDDLVSSLVRQNYVVDVEYSPGGFEVDLMKNRIIININGELTLTKAGETSKQEDFTIIISSRFYDTALVVQEIISRLAESCNFKQVGYMLVYPQWNIDPFPIGDLTIIYTIENRATKEKFRFAVRGCVMSPGP